MHCAPIGDVANEVSYVAVGAQCIYIWLFRCLISFIYLSSLPVVRLSDDPRRRLVVTGDSARVQDETTKSSTWFFNVLGV